MLPLSDAQVATLLSLFGSCCCALDTEANSSRVTHVVDADGFCHPVESVNKEQELFLSA